jgi:hypothetical protein
MTLPLIKNYLTWLHLNFCINIIMIKEDTAPTAGTTTYLASY